MIECDNISFGYPGHSDIIENLSLSINEGEAVSLMGANGSGKTSLARCLNGLLQPRSGTITIDGRKKRGLRGSSKSALIGMVFQNPDNQIVSTTIEREIAFGLENLQVPHDKMHKVVLEMLTEFDFLKRRLNPPHKLSGGEKQLLALAAVLAMEPKYLILDEPTSLLDPRSRKAILKLIFSSASGRPRGFTPLLITQFPEETLWTDRLLILEQGKILIDDKPRQVFKQVEALQKIGLPVPAEFLLGLDLEIL